MKVLTISFLFGIMFLLLQTSVLPLFFAPNWCPNLLLILLLFLALSENLLHGLLAGLVLGAIQDSFTSTSLGLYISIYLLIVLATNLLSDKFNSESQPLLLLLVAAATVLQNVLIGLFLTVFAHSTPPLSMFITALPPQMLTNMFFAFIGLSILLRLQKLLGKRSGMAGLMGQSTRHGS